MTQRHRASVELNGLTDEKQMRHIILKVVRIVFYLTFSNIEEFLSLNIPNLNIGLKIFVVKYNIYGIYVTVVIEKVNENCIHDPLLGLG